VGPYCVATQAVEAGEGASFAVSAAEIAAAAIFPLAHAEHDRETGAGSAVRGAGRDECGARGHPKGSFYVSESAAENGEGAEVPGGGG